MAYRSSSSSGVSQLVSSLAPSVPSGVQSGDIVVCYLYRWESTNNAVTPPAGFTHFGTQINQGAGSTAKMDLFYKTLSGADSGTYTFSWTGAMWSTAQVVAFSGCTGTPTVIASNTVASGTALPTISGTSTTAADLLYCHGSDNGGSLTAPTSYTLRHNDDGSQCATRDAVAAGSQSVTGGSYSVDTWQGAYLVQIDNAGAAAAGEVARPVRFAPGLYAPGGVLKPPPRGAATAVPNSIPSAENAAGTGAANSAAPNVGAAAGGAAGTGAASNAAPSVAVAAGNAAGTGAANQPTVSTTGSQNAAAGLASGTGAANPATVTVSPAAGNAAGTGTAYDATVTTSVAAVTDPDQARPQIAPMFFNPPRAATQLAGDTYVAPTGSAQAGVATGTGAANQPTIAVATAAGNAAGTGTANNATVTTGSNANATAGVATGTGAANNTVITVGPAAGSGSGTGSAGGATDSVAATAGNAAGTGTANAPNVSTTGSTNVQAGLASGTGAANQPSVGVSSTAGNAAGTGAANAPRPSVAPAAGRAAGTGAANNASVTAPNATAGNAAGTGAAYQPMVVISAAAARATGAGSAGNATTAQAVSVAAGSATGTGQAFTTTNGVPVVLYPISAGTVTDLTSRNTAGVIVDQATRYDAGTPV